MWDWADFIKEMMASASTKCRVFGCSEPTQTNQQARFRVCKAGHFDFGGEKPPTVRANG